MSAFFLLLFMVPKVLLVPSSLLSNDDVGDPARAGSFHSEGATHIITGSGSDIWSSSDQFYFTYRTVSENSEVTVRIESLNGPHQWSKVGLMMRASLKKDSANVFIGYAPLGNAFFQYRAVAGQNTEQEKGTTLEPPFYLKLSRSGDIISGYTSKDGEYYSLLSRIELPLGTKLYAGVALSSHDPAHAARAKFADLKIMSQLTLTPTPTSTPTTFPSPTCIPTVTPTPHPTALPTPQTALPEVPAPRRQLNSSFESADIGTVGKTGHARVRGERVYIKSSGSDIWTVQDQFHFVFQKVERQSLTLTAKLESFDASDEWAKAGLMIRESLHTASPNVFLVSTRDHGFRLQIRSSTSTTTNETQPTYIKSARYLRLTFKNGIVEAAVSKEKKVWTSVGTFAFPLAQEFYVGFAVTSHNNEVLANAVFSEAELTLS